MEFNPIPKSKYDEVIHHLRHNFPDEPLNAAVGLCKYGVPCEILEHHDIVTMDDGLSIMAVDKGTGEIAGIALNGISRRGDVETALAEQNSIDNLPYRRIFGLLNEVNHAADLFAKYGVDRIFEIRILSVDAKHRGRGLAKQLFQRSELIAEEHGFRLAKTDATSYFTQKVAEAAGFFCERAARYADYKDASGVRIYEIEAPHDYYKIMVKLIGQQVG